MAESSETLGSIRFGRFDLSGETGELRKDGVRLKLSGQAVEVLLLLVASPGKLVTREDLQQKLWPGASYGDPEHGLNAAVNRLREALGDSATEPKYIETVPGRGYRFIAPLIDSRPTSATLPAAESNVSPAQTITGQGALPASEASERRPLSRRLLIGGVFMLAVLAVAVALLSRLSRRSSGWDFQAMKLSRVTQSGNAGHVAVSPDGRYVVYALVDGEKQSLRVRQVATGSDVQILPPNEVWFYGLTFSPDDNYIDFVRSEKNNQFNTYLYRMPVLGGTPHLVTQGGADSINSYSPDGTHFSYMRVDGEKLDVLIAKADGSDERVLATTSTDVFTGTAWSPDGRTIAFATLETTHGLRNVLWNVSVSDGSIHEIYSTPDAIGQPRWLSDGSGLLVTIGDPSQAFRGQLWFVSFPEGLARRLTNDLMDYQTWGLDLSRDGKTIVDIEKTRVSDLWVAPAGDSARAKQITSKDVVVGGFSWTPSGSIVFDSADGNIFSVHPDGSGRTLLTPSQPFSSWPSVCGDGQYVVFTSYREQRLGVWRMNADGSNPVRIADESLAQTPQCSPDGKRVLYLRAPGWFPMRVPIGGEKPPELLVPEGVVTVGMTMAKLKGSTAISPNGKLVAYVTFATPGVNVGLPSASKPLVLKIIPFDGGAPLHQLDWPALAGDPHWAPGGEAVEYVLTRSGVSNIWEQKLTGGPPKEITNFQSGLIVDFHWSPDGKQLALTRGGETSDVIMISNFR